MPLDMMKVLNGTELLETVLDTRVVPRHSKAVKLLAQRWKQYVELPGTWVCLLC